MSRGRSRSALRGCLAGAIALLASTPAAATVELVGVDAVPFAWAAASGAVTGYLVSVARNGGPLVVSQLVGEASAVVPVQAGEEIRVSVRAVGTGSNGTPILGPASESSEPVRIEAPPVFRASGRWTLRCSVCETLMFRALSDGTPTFETEAPSAEWLFGGFARIGAPYLVWWSPAEGWIALQSLLAAYADPRAAQYPYQAPLDGRSLAGIADVDHDGLDELVLHDAQTGVVEFWRIADGSLGPVAGLVVPTQSRLAAVADLSGDGSSELVWQLPALDAVVAWRLEAFRPTGVYTMGYLAGGAGSSARLAGVADYDGDGFRDLLWQAADGMTSIWYLRSGVVQRVVALAFEEGDDRRDVVGSADVDGAPGSEIALQHRDTGVIEIVYPRGGSDAVREVVLTPGSRWRVVDLQG